MKGYFLPNESWEKQQKFQLPFGYIVTIEYSQIYGDFVSRIDKSDGSYWHCSNGIANLPDFAKLWIRGGNGPDSNLVTPKFEKCFN